MSQIITGICLALYYVPSADHAHTIVSYIVKEVTSGSFIRSIHAYGSSGIIILLLCTSDKQFYTVPIRVAGNFCGSPAAFSWL